ncbi:ATPase RavA domain-containing protein, partial [Vibrio splendidus]
PHNYIDPDLPKAMESSLQAVTQDLETTKVKSSKIAQRIKFMSQYFE